MRRGKCFSGRPETVHDIGRNVAIVYNEGFERKEIGSFSTDYNPKSLYFEQYWEITGNYFYIPYETISEQALEIEEIDDNETNGEFRFSAYKSPRTKTAAEVKKHLWLPEEEKLCRMSVDYDFEGKRHTATIYHSREFLEKVRDTIMVKAGFRDSKEKQ